MIVVADVNHLSSRELPKGHVDGGTSVETLNISAPDLDLDVGEGFLVFFALEVDLPYSLA
jgi:hypothetical protein